MTSTTATAPLPELSTRPRSLATRVLAVVRLLFGNPWTSIYTPLLILTFIMLMNVAIWGMIRASIPPEGEMASGGNGGSLFLFIYMLVVAVQSVNQTFHLALGYGSTRRDFMLGFGGFAVILSVGYAVLLATLTAIETATNGWGIELGFFATATVGLENWGEAVLFGTLGFLLFFGIGAATASVYVRWKAMGMYVFWAALVVLVVGGAALITWAQAWPQVGEFFVVAGFIGSAAWSLIITAFCALAAWLILRRATPSQG